jgi:zinc protease
MTNLRFYFHSLTAALLSTVFLAAGTLQAPAQVFNPTQFVLENGMQVVVVPNHRVPVVIHMVWYKTGSADEPPGHSGIAHFLEHLMFKGTSNLQPGEFSEVVARNGGQQNAFTSYDYTAYYQVVAKDRLGLVMQMEADRMANLVFSDEQLKSEKLVVLEERRQRIDNRPAALLSEQADAALYLKHPYRRPIIGWESEIKEITKAELSEFYKNWYAPNNAILVVGGDITADELRPLAEKYYGVIPSSKTPAQFAKGEPLQTVTRRVLLKDERVRQPSWTRIYSAPSYLSGASEYAHSLEVLAHYLGGGSTSRLYRRLVVEQKLAVSAGAWYEPTRRGPSRLILFASPRENVSMDDIENAVDSILNELLEKGPPDEEIQRAKRRMLADAVYARDDLSTGAQVLGEALAIGLSIEDVEDWPQRISAVNKEKVVQAAALVIDPARSVTTTLLGNGSVSK